MMTINQAEQWLATYKTRENAEAADDVETWDEAYEIAYGAFYAERDFTVKR